MTEGKESHQCVLLENLLPLRSQLNRQHRHLPPTLTPTHLDARRPPDDLMPKAHTNHPHAILLQKLLRELHQLEDPRVVVKRVVLCT